MQIDMYISLKTKGTREKYKNNEKKNIIYMQEKKWKIANKKKISRLEVV